MKNTYRRHKLRITPETLAEFKRARRRELIRRGRPVPDVLLPSETVEPKRQLWIEEMIAAVYPLRNRD